MSEKTRRASPNKPSQAEGDAETVDQNLNEKRLAASRKNPEQRRNAARAERTADRQQEASGIPSQAEGEVEIVEQSLQEKQVGATSGERGGSKRQASSSPKRSRSRKQDSTAE